MWFWTSRTFDHQDSSYACKYRAYELSHCFSSTAYIKLAVIRFSFVWISYVMLTDILRGLIVSGREFEVLFSATYWGYDSSTLQWSRSLECLKLNSDYSRELYITIPTGTYYFFFQKCKFTYEYLEIEYRNNIVPF